MTKPFHDADEMTFVALSSWSGRDTTAATLSWFVYLLSLHPEVAEKVFEELHLIVEEDNKTLCGANSTRNGEMIQFASLLTYDVISRLHYLHAAITETIRLYPAVPQVLNITGPTTPPTTVFNLKIHRSFGRM